MAKKLAARRGRPSSLSRLDTATLHRELQRRQRDAARLMVRRVQLQDEIAKLEAELAALGAGVAARRGRSPGGRKRARNAATLVESLSAALKAKTMSAPEVAKAVVAAGYKTTSRNFLTQVRIALAKRGVFKRVSRGQYTTR